jgi:DNA polymerase I-like protein with 3'-5' exonuclease and polymerase domains
MFGGYAIIRKLRSRPPENCRVLTSLPPDLEEFGKQPVAFDFETHGVDPTTGSIRSISLANDHGTVAIDCEQLSSDDRMRLTRWLLKQKLIAHNAVFDAGWIYAKTGTMPDIEACTLVLFKLLATEGFLGQRWGLKSAMTDLLGWPESNEVDLYNWLKSNKLKAKDMAQAPWEILGKYNALDAAATWQLYKHLVAIIEAHEMTEQVLEFHRKDFVTLIKLAIEQQMSGMTVDVKALAEFDQKLEGQIEDKRHEFLNHPEVRDHVKYYQSVIVEEIEKAEPPKLTKKGDVTARHLKWQEKLAEAKSRIDFNIDSPKQLQWLFYERLFYECPIKTDKGMPSVGKKAFPHLGELGRLMKEYRELRDRRKFVTALGNVQRDGVFHPNVKIHGTVTGRSSGGVDS